MKFEDLLMQPSEEKQRRRDLEEEVENLQQELDGELQLKGILQCALQGPPYSCPCIPRMSALLPHKVQLLLAEIAMVEEEIVDLERKVDELKLNYYREKQQNAKDWEMMWSEDLQPQVGPKRPQKRLLCRLEHHIDDKDCEKFSTSQNSEERRKHRILKERRASLGCSMDFQSIRPPRSNEEVGENSSGSRRHYTPFDIEIDFERPNRLSEEVITCLIDIFMRLNQEALKTKGSAIFQKDDASYMNSKGFISKTSRSSAALALPFDGKTSNADPYGILLLDVDGAVRDVGAYKNFIQITTSTLDTSRLTSFHPEMRKLRVLVHELRNVDLTYLSYKQKLAFWINVYNACIMQALLQHGLPLTKEKLLGLMKESTINVGGLVLNALAIERYILRLPSDSKHRRRTNEKEMMLRHTYGLGYPEPSITFALCRGTWSSPALRIYKPDQVVNDLERAKVEYLEASVGVTSKKKIHVPKLMQWHMRDFADDMESLAEWIYSQLPRSAALKRLIMECLNGETKSPPANTVEVQPYVFDFRYLLAL